MGNKNDLWKRLLSFGLAVHMTLSNVPFGALAEELGKEDCVHHSVHTAQCGYAEAVEGTPCAHEHGEDCYVLAESCLHSHEDACGYDEAVEDSCTHLCSEDTSCVTKTLSCTHAHDETCGYVEAVEAAECGFVCPICPVQALIDALPEEVTGENAEAVTEVLAQIDVALEALTEEDLARIDFAKYDAAKAALEALTAEETTEATEETEESSEATEGNIAPISIETPESLDDIAWEDLTYRDIFIENNLVYVDGFNGKTFSPFVQSAGTNTITADACYTAPYALAAFGSPSQQVASAKTLGVGGDFFLASKVYCTRYAAGTLGVCLGTHSVGVQAVTDGFVTAPGIVSAEAANKAFLGSFHSADLDGYVDDPVAIPLSMFETVPTQEQLTALYENYVALEKAIPREEIRFTDEEKFLPLWNI